MTLNLRIYDCLCETAEFKINGIDADYCDFGEKYDCEREYADDYCCGNMRFFPKVANETVLKKYNITADEYRAICEELESNLSFGSCGWCS